MVSLPAAPTQALLAAIVEGSDEAIISKTLDGIITSWNPAAQRILGYSPEEVLGKHVSFLFPPGADEEPAIIGRIRKGERVDHYHTKRVRKDGTLIDVTLTVSPVRDEQGNIVAASKILRPESSQEGLFRAATENALDAIVSADASGRITYLNPAAQRLFGLGGVEAVGQPLTILMPERFQDGHRGGFARYLASGQARIIGKTVEVAGRHKDGHEFPVEISLGAWEAEGGRLFVAILRDVTERKKADEARIAARAREAEVERLEEMNRFKTMFINTAAHELLNPITPMRAVLHVMRKNPDRPPGRLVREIDILSRNMERLNRLVSELLDASRLEARKLGLHLRDIDLARLVKEAVESFQPEAAAKGVRLAPAQAPGAIPMQGDADRLAQVLYNLLSNAIKFTPPGGRVECAVSLGPEGAILRVQDTGVGFDAVAQAKLFRPFSRAHLASDQAEPGTGLGLYVTKGIVELHGGRIRCESPGPGRGALFEVVLPL
ncbi:MAG TPA: PAS domain-containing sensor histidine kinase [Candidatus Thermoplasmatota archaeon]|nr:PAS domain-containing sensor histidine kinase [Candidatus Thermoplasmatota archaeon]